MAFAIRNLSVLAYAQGFTLWHYKATEDRVADAGGAEYFEGASDLLAAGDMLMISGRDGGRMMVVTPGVGGGPAGGQAAFTLSPLG